LLHVRLLRAVIKINQSINQFGKRSHRRFVTPRGSECIRPPCAGWLRD